MPQCDQRIGARGAAPSQPDWWTVLNIIIPPSLPPPPPPLLSPPLPPPPLVQDPMDPTVTVLDIGWRSGIILYETVGHHNQPLFGIHQLPLVDTHDHPAVCRRCVAVGRMLQNISLQTHATAWNEGL